MREFELVDRLRHRLAPRRADTTVGIGDDAAVFVPAADHELVITTDMLVSGRHFPDDTPADDIGYKTLAVNFSDVAAMGAEPAWLTVSLSAPTLDADFCESLVDGFRSACVACPAQAPIDVVGGDTTGGPVLSLSITAIGQLPVGTAIRRDGARAGDVIAVTGTLGDAAAGLACWPDRATADAVQAALIARLTRPDLRRGTALRGHANAAIDVSDGLLADLGHILAASGVGARLWVDALPCSSALRAQVSSPETRRRLQATGGDDYELCVALPADQVAPLRRALDCPLTVVGEITAAAGLVCVDGTGRVVERETFEKAGWDHFAPD